MTGPTASGQATTRVHLVRHGEVDNPAHVLYGRLPGYRLSELGVQMAERVAQWAADRDVAAVIASPLERAQQTAAPIAAAHAVPVDSDERLIEAGNHFQGLTFGVGDGSLRHPRHWRYLVNPMRPSWGEPYRLIVARVLGAVADARSRAQGHEVLLVSHQLPIWVTRLYLEDRHLWHDPRKRECSLASVTTLTYVGRDLLSIGYSEPAADLLPSASKVAGA
jgi:broad specificity phosphatase PhoE